MTNAPTVLPERRDTSAGDLDVLLAQETPDIGISRPVVFSEAQGQSTIRVSKPRSLENLLS